MAVVCDWFGGFCGTDIHSGKSWNRGSELESCDGDPYLCCPGDGVGDGISDTCRKRACKYWKEELAVSDSVGALYRCFMASKVVPVDKMSTVLTLILAFIFLHETINTKSIIGMLLLTAGTLVMVIS